MKTFRTPEEAEAFWSLFAETTHESIKENKEAIAAVLIKIERHIEKFNDYVQNDDSPTKQDHLDLWKAVNGIKEARIICSNKHFGDDKQNAIDVVSLAKDVDHQNKRGNMVRSAIISIAVGIVIAFASHFLTVSRDRTQLKAEIRAEILKENQTLIK